MEDIEKYQLIAMWAFPLCILFIALGLWQNWLWILAPICFGVFIYATTKRDAAIAATLDDLGCTYIGSGKKGQPHVPATKFYSCTWHDGIIRSSRG